jgi:uncharacterized protein
MTEFKFGAVKIEPSAYGSQGSAVLGIRDSGKSYTATELAEKLFEAGIPFVAFDPIGVWRFLRVPGHGRGYPVVVAGGKAGDLPLSVASAPEYVRAAMRDGVSLVIDLFDINLSKADWKRIVTACVRVLLHENSEHGLRHVFIEEAAEFAPQRVGPDQGQVYAEIEKLARMGGNSRLGYTLINQRAEEVNKAVLELCDNLFLHRQKGRNSLTALSKWLDIADVKDHRAIIDSLPNLPTGECWAWMAGTARPVHTKVPAKNSLHPDRRVMRGDGDIKAKAAVDVGAFVSSMRSSLGKIEAEAKANDPAALKKRIAELERLHKAPGASQADVSAAEQRGYDRGSQAARATVAEALRGVVQSANDLTVNLRGISQTVEQQPKTAPVIYPARVVARALPDKPIGSPARATGEQSDLPRGEIAVLSACIQYPDGLRREQLTVLTGYRRSTRDAYIQRLRERGYLETVGDKVTATVDGIAALPDARPLPVGAALQEFWTARLPDGERKILSALIEAYPNSVDRESLDDSTGFKRSTRDAYLQRLSAKELISEPRRGAVQASAQLFG